MTDKWPVALGVLKAYVPNKVIKYLSGSRRQAAGIKIYNIKTYQVNQLTAVAFNFANGRE